MKNIMLSIHPHFCSLIASGKKTLELRKTYPKEKTPFKCFIYETKRGYGRGQVIGEFICDGILPISITYSNTKSIVANMEWPFICLSDKEIIDYLGNSVTGYGWHISDLVIYDKPKELKKFSKCGFFHVVPLERPPLSWCYVDEILDGLLLAKTIFLSCMNQNDEKED